MLTKVDLHWKVNIYSPSLAEIRTILSGDMVGAQSNSTRQQLFMTTHQKPQKTSIEKCRFSVEKVVI